MVKILDKNLRKRVWHLGKPYYIFDIKFGSMEEKKKYSEITTTNGILIIDVLETENILKLLVPEDFDEGEIWEKLEITWW